ncbi:hypothetical protein B0H10DRAFT_679546 [Mycena sp. CBHHK59/15]|nr:hypothetical protein B0H10DRAFT_679546 [Mycena sp. CBHHK59/15]
MPFAFGSGNLITAPQRAFNVAPSSVRVNPESVGILALSDANSIPSGAVPSGIAPSDISPSGSVASAILASNVIASVQQP